MFIALHRLAAFPLLLCAVLRAGAQQTPHIESSFVSGAASFKQEPKIPEHNSLGRGFNAAITFSGVHDSALGWYSVSTPSVSYSLTQRFGADASISIYPSRNIPNTNFRTLRANPLLLEYGQLGDAYLGIHATFNPRLLRNTTTASFTFPTGERSTGIGAGKFTFDFSNQMEHDFKRAGLILDAGAGNSSGLFNRLITKNYTSVGALTHFQQGVIVWLPRNSYVEYVAYQQVPVGGQTLYTNPGFPGRTVFSGSSIGRDFGLTTFVGIPLSTHLTLSSYYSRSFSQPRDTVSVGLTFVMRRTPGTGRLSMVDRALRESEQFSQQPAAQ